MNKLLCQSRMFQLYSAQTGSLYGKVEAISESDAVDQFARKQGFVSRRAMWGAGRFEYVSAEVA